jgi:hypothetical protein
VGEEILLLSIAQACIIHKEALPLAQLIDGMTYCHCFCEVPGEFVVEELV